MRYYTIHKEFGFSRKECLDIVNDIIDSIIVAYWIVFIFQIVIGVQEQRNGIILYSVVMRQQRVSI